MNGSRELTIPNRVRSASAMTGKCQKNRSQVKFISTYREAQKYAAGMTSRAISAGRLLTFRNAHIKCVDCGNKAYHYEHRSYNHPEITVLIDFPSYPDGDPRDADEIIDTWLMKPDGFID